MSERMAEHIWIGGACIHDQLWTRIRLKLSSTRYSTVSLYYRLQLSANLSQLSCSKIMQENSPLITQPYIHTSMSQSLLTALCFDKTCRRLAAGVLSSEQLFIRAPVWTDRYLRYTQVRFLHGDWSGIKVQRICRATEERCKCETFKLGCFPFKKLENCLAYQRGYFLRMMYKNVEM